MWQVVGGVGNGGILVRIGRELDSPKVPTRLSTGAVTRELEVHGDRLKYWLISGEGPHEGWVSTKLKNKDLLVKTADEVDEDPACEAPVGEAPADEASAITEGQQLLQQYLMGDLAALVQDYHTVLRGMPRGPSPVSVDATSRPSGVPMPFCPNYIPVSQDEARTKLLFLGDSITHGSPSCPSAPFCAAIAQQNHQKVVVENAGWGGLFSFQLLDPQECMSSLGPLCLPALESYRCDYACILIGTNDAMTICAPTTWTDLVKTVSSLEKQPGPSPRLPDDWKSSAMYNPSMELFEKSLETIVRRLQAATGARVAIATPPLLGDDLTETLPERRMRASPFVIIQSMAAAVWRVASAQGCDVLPLTECMTQHITELQADGRKQMPWTFNASFKLMQACGPDWVETAKPLEECGPQEMRPALTYDLVHFNEAGAAIYAALVQRWLNSLLK